jgi:hypothetical protein
MLEKQNIQDSKLWAFSLFGQCDLGDPRRVKRLVKFAATQAENPELSISSVCENESVAEGAYRLLKNDKIETLKFEEGPFLQVAEICQDQETILAIQDTTAVEITHLPLRKEVQEKGLPSGFSVHSTLMVDAQTGIPLGLIDQSRWRQKKDSVGGKKNLKDKKSAKWQSASERMLGRLKNPESVITVCDREADMFEFLNYNHSHGNRYIVRCNHNRRTKNSEKLFDEIDGLASIAEKTLTIQQRGPFEEFGRRREGRKKKSVELQISAGEVKILRPEDLKEGPKEIAVNVVLVKEAGNPEGLVWRIFTNESIDTPESVHTIVSYYERRWLIEDFQKCWKSGCKVEERALQTIDGLERFMIISSAIAVRILQLKHLAEACPNLSCEIMFSRAQWHSLHVLGGNKNAIPQTTPNLKWAYKSIGKLGGFKNSKQTGKIGWKTLWTGWQKFQDQWIGWQMAHAHLNIDL